MPADPQPEKMLRVALAGYGSLGAALLRGLITSPFCQVVGVFRWESTRAGHAMKDEEERSLRTLIQEFGFDDLVFDSINDYPFSAWLTQYRADVLLVGSWGEILRPHLLSTPGLQLINCHPAKLPAHRGANPYTSVILSGETESGVTFHRMSERPDEGPMLLQETLPVSPEETGETLRNSTSLLAERMVAPLLVGLSKPGGMPEMIQAPQVASYFPPLSVEDGLIDFNQQPERILSRQRALHPWLTLYTFVAGTALLRFEPLALSLKQQPLRQQHYTPGTVLSATAGQIQIATARSGEVLAAERFALYLSLGGRWGGFLPVWLSRLLLPFCVRPGQLCGAEQVSGVSVA